MARTNTIEILIKASDQASSVVSGMMKSVERSFDRASKSMLQSGAALGFATAPAIAGFASAVNTARAFDESMTNVGAVLGKTKAQMQALNAEVLAIGAASRAGPQAASEAFYDIVGGVADASTHMAILEAAIATAEAGSADLGGTTSALIAIMNSYAFSAEQAGFASDVLTQTVGAGVGSMEEFAAAMPQVAGLASSLGIGFDDLGASMAFLTTKGFSASQSATQLRAMMVAMLNPNAKLAKSLAEVGFVSGTAAIEQLGLVGAYRLLSDESSTFQSNMAGAVGSVEALNGVISLTDESFQQFSDDFVSSAEGATEAARKIQLDSFAAQMDILNSSVEALKIEIGMGLLPVLTRLVRGATPAIQAITRWATENKEVISTVGIFVGVLAGLSALMLVVGGAFAVASVAMGNLPIIGLAAGLTGVLAIINAVANRTDHMRIAFESMFNALKQRNIEAFKSMLKYFVGIDIDAMVASIKAPFVALIDDVTNRISFMKIAIDSMINALNQGNLEAFQAMLKYFTGIDLDKLGIDLDKVVQRYDSFTETIGKAREKIGAVKASASELPDKFSAAFGSISSSAQLAEDKIKSSLEGIAIPSVDFSSLKERIETKLNDLFGSLELDPIDLGAIIAGAFGVVAITDFKPIADSIGANFDTILKIAIPLALGGGFGGLVISAVIKALETDFLGFRTAILNSSVTEELTAGVDKLKQFTEGLFGEGFGEGEAPSFAQLETFASTVQSSLQPLFDFLGQVAEPITQGLSDLGEGFVGFLAAFEGTETGNIASALQSIAEGVAVFMGAFALVASEVLGATLTAIGDFLPKLGEGISSLITSIDRLLGGDFGGALSSLGDGILTISTALTNFQLDTLTGIASGIADLAGVDLSSAGANVGNKILEGIDVAFLGIPGKMTEAVRTIADTLGVNETNLGALADAGWAVGQKVIDSIKEKFVDVAEWVWNDVLLPITNQLIHPGNLTKIIDQVLQIGGAIISGIKKGIQDGWNGFVQWVLSQIGGLVGDVLDALDAHSPSRVFAEIGKNIVDGMAAGINDFGPVSSAAANMTTAAITPAANARLTPGATAGGGAGSNITITGPVTIQTNDDPASAWDKLEAEARRRNREFAPRAAR